MFDLSFYKEKKVFVTGHTGFKGSWLCKILANAGAEVTGYSLNSPTSPSLFEIAKIKNDIHSVIGDVRDKEILKKAFDEAQPEIVLHLAAQPIVRDSYKDPVYTYETMLSQMLMMYHHEQEPHLVFPFPKYFLSNIPIVISNNVCLCFIIERSKSEIILNVFNT